MSYRIKTISTAMAAALVAATSSAAMAGSARNATAVSVPAVIGAAYNDASRADSFADVRRQGGFASAGVVRWLARAPEVATDASPAYHVPGVIGAMNETRGLARSAEEVRRAGGFATAGVVTWAAHPPQAKAVAAF